MALSVHVYDPMGRHITRVPALPPSWRQTISHAGSLSVTVPDCPELRRLDLSRLLREYGSIWAVQSGRTVRHAGWLLHARVDDSGSLAVDLGDGWSIWDKRIVARYQLMASWRDGEVLIDEDHPPGDWVLSLHGTYRDIVRDLMAESMRFGPLPYSLPDRQGGREHVRDYDVWDFATVGQRITDITALDGGPEIRYDPYLSDDDRLYWTPRVGVPEIVDHKWRIDLDRPGDRATLTGLDLDGEDMTGEVFGLGGRKDDKVLTAHASRPYLTDRGWPVLQSADTSHSTVSRLDTLQGHILDELRSGARPQITVGLRLATLGPDIHVGDWVSLKARPRGGGTSLARHALSCMVDMDPVPLKVTDLSVDTASAAQTIQARVRW